MSTPPASDPQRPELITGVPQAHSIHGNFVNPPGAPPAAPSPKLVPTRNGPATASLVLGIVAIVTSVLFVPALVGFVLGVVGLKRSGRITPPVGRGRALTGLTLSVLSTILGVVLIAAIAATSPQGRADKALDDVGQSAPTSSEAESPDDGTTAPDDEPADTTETQHYDLADFRPIDASAWDLIARNPDSAVGDTIVVFAEVTQFDAATGTDTFRANVGATRPAAEYELETNTILSGDEAVLNDVVAGDVLEVHAVVAGAVDYETQIGGSTTVPLLAVAQVENVGFADLSKDVKLGTPSRDEFGYVTIIATVTNNGTETFTYSVEVVAESKDGTTSYGTGSGFAESLNPGQKTTVSIDFFDDVPPDAVFRVGPVDRYGT
jgi:hypothetical protein